MPGFDETTREPIETDPIRERVIIFVDGPGLDRMIKQIGKTVDYAKLKEFLADGRQLVEARFYLNESSPMTVHREMLESLGYRIIIVPHGHHVNTNIANELRQIHGRTDTVILVGGDNFYAQSVSRLITEHAKTVEIFYPKDAIQSDYDRIPFKYIEPMNYLEEIGAKDLPKKFGPRAAPTTTTPPARPRVLIFIDGPNLNGMQDAIRTSFDAFLLKQLIVGNRELVEARYYMPVPSRNPATDEFKRVLERMGFNVYPGPMDEDVDPVIIEDIDRLSKAEIADTLILVSGDWAFRDKLVDAMSIRNQAVEIYCVDRCLSSTYKQVPGFKIFDLSREEYLIQIADQARTQMRYSQGEQEMPDEPTTPTAPASPASAVAPPPAVAIVTEAPVAFEVPEANDIRAFANAMFASMECLVEEGVTKVQLTVDKNGVRYSAGLNISPLG